VRVQHANVPLRIRHHYASVLTDWNAGAQPRLDQACGDLAGQTRQLAAKAA